MRLVAVLPMEASTPELFPNPGQKFSICSAVGEKLQRPLNTVPVLVLLWSGISFLLKETVTGPHSHSCVLWSSQNRQIQCYTHREVPPPTNSVQSPSPLRISAYICTIVKISMHLLWLFHIKCQTLQDQTLNNPISFTVIKSKMDKTVSKTCMWYNQ